MLIDDFTIGEVRVVMQDPPIVTILLPSGGELRIAVFPKETQEKIMKEVHRKMEAT